MYYESIKSHYNKTKSQIPVALPKRWSDGHLWIEYLKEMMSAENIYDFARSGATVNNSIVPRSIQDLGEQVQAYSRFFNQAHTDAIHFIWIGLNDIHDIFQGHSNRSQIMIDEVSSSFYNSLSKLYESKAKYMFVLNVIPLGDLPKFYTLSQAEKAHLDSMVRRYNANLAKVMNDLVEKRKDEGLHVYLYDAYENFADLCKNMRGSPSSCNRGSHCDNLVWWDDLHLTTKVHFALASSVYKEFLATGW
ncbi:hypothetical protein RMATCC62417_08774 [Rhizopus microsporus]|nr:hypothetical protein RMATCC62417_08774 [Rhizopus microsporus]